MSHRTLFACVMHISLFVRSGSLTSFPQVSVGIENISDIIADFEHALKVVP